MQRVSFMPVICFLSFYSYICILSDLISFAFIFPNILFSHLSFCKQTFPVSFHRPLVVSFSTWKGPVFRSSHCLFEVDMSSCPRINCPCHQRASLHLIALWVTSNWMIMDAHSLAMLPICPYLHDVSLWTYRTGPERAGLIYVLPVKV